MSAPTLTTAMVLGALRRELIEEGIPAHVADDIVRNAGCELADSGVSIKNPAETVQS